MELEKTPSSKHLVGEPSSPSPSSSTAPALVLSGSGKRIDQFGKKKYVKQVTGRHNDTELHLAANRGDVVAVKQILDDINDQMVGNLTGEDFDLEVADIRASVVNEVNELGETALHTAADKGHIEVVKELLKYANKETLTKKNISMFDPLHIAACQGHHGWSSTSFSSTLVFVLYIVSAHLVIDLSMQMKFLGVWSFNLRRLSCCYKLQ